MNLNPDILAPTSKFRKSTFMAIGRNAFGTIYSNGTYHIAKQSHGSTKARWFATEEANGMLVASDARFSALKFKCDIHADLLLNWNSTEAFQRLNTPGIESETVIAAYR